MHALTLLSFRSATMLADLWVCCNACMNPQKREKRLETLVFHDADYTRLLLRLNPAYMPMCSLLRANLNISSHYRGYDSGAFSPQHPLDGPLVVWSADGRPDPSFIPPELRELLARLLQTNPYVRTYATLAEQPHPQHPYISMDALTSIVRDNAERDPTRAPH